MKSAPEESLSDIRDMEHYSRLSIKTRQEKKDDEMQFVEFLLGHEFFAVNLFHTREVIVQGEITPIPNTPDYIRGVMDLRGSITTIIDVKILLNIPQTDEKIKKSRIIILDQQNQQKPIGILVDDVYSVSSHRLANIDKKSKSDPMNPATIQGVIRKTMSYGEREEHKLILWLDILAIRQSVERDL